MPIEVNRVNRQCPQCKNPTIFNTGKGYFCGKCLTDFPKETFAKDVITENNIQENNTIIPEDKTDEINKE